jgi:hypothetical protein
MEEHKPDSREELKKKILPLVVKELQREASRESVMDKIKRVGLSQQESADVLSQAIGQAGFSAPPPPPPLQPAANPKAAAILSEIAATPKQKSYLITLVAGLAAAVAGGALWGAVAMLFKKEFGFVALLMGVGPGLAVMYFAHGRKGLALKVPAVLCTLFAILLGKYLSFVFLARQYAGDDPVKAQFYHSLSYFSFEAMFGFFSYLPKSLRISDAVWVMIAVINAFMLAEPPRELSTQNPVKK